MRSRLLVLGLAVAALMGLRVNAESGATADPAPAPACAACGAASTERENQLSFVMRTIACAPSRAAARASVGSVSS